MREKLNESQAAQVGLVAILVVVATLAVRFVPPIEDALLAPGRNNYLAALSRLRGAGVRA